MDNYFYVGLSGSMHLANVFENNKNKQLYSRWLNYIHVVDKRKKHGENEYQLLLETLSNKKLSKNNKKNILSGVNVFCKLSKDLGVKNKNVLMHV